VGDLGGLVIGDKQAKLPIIQGQMAVDISLERLVGAVAAEGAVGLLAGTSMMAPGKGPETMYKQIKEARRLAGNGIVGVGIMYVVSQFEHILDAAIEAKVDLVVIGAGFAREPFTKLAQAGIPGWAIISSEKLASIVCRLPNIVGVVVESGTAGGHLGPKDPEISIWDLFPGVYRTLRQGGFRGPIAAAGGIRYGWEVRRLLDMGADAVQIGTLFAMTEESNAPPVMKEVWRKAKGSKVSMVSPVGMPSRAVLEQDLDRLPKLPPSPKACIDCLKLCLHKQDRSQKHCIYRSLVNSVFGRIKVDPDGAVHNGLVFTGSRVGEIDDIVPAAKRIERLVEEMREGPEAPAGFPRPWEKE
jgi:NAD(P)H-dependent flavin oxidoreductase YrpB (nitropropane dioxygenase family)